MGRIGVMHYNGFPAAEITAPLGGISSGQSELGIANI